MTYLHNYYHLVDEFIRWKPIQFTTDVSSVAVTPVCEIIHSPFQSLGTGS